MTRLSVGIALFSTAGMVIAATALDHRDTNARTVEYELGWGGVGGGGAVLCEGGDFSLSGTVGRPSDVVLTGDTYTVSGGFSVPAPPGDCNTDGGVDLTDFDPFEECLIGPLGGALPSDCGCFDVDLNDAIDLRDFGRLQRRFGGS